MVPVAGDLQDFAIDVLDRLEVARFPAEHVMAVLGQQLQAPGAALQRTAWSAGATQVVPHGTDLLEPMTAQRAAGGRPAWQPPAVSAAHRAPCSSTSATSTASWTPGTG
ncbi:hypothetical protein [Kineococcus indalonis]|uniref:hypothetical protein n=1 Tax=Kineococcus indalonis TaxID=2696566 RepID=UPI001411C56A|nr:hypothetical protein [Kineococcus indalonis]NAZ84772.1 hypothetical protein [Kineococcus indalonis]